MADVSSSGGGILNRRPINLHDWAVWRMHLNEKMANGMIDRANLKQMKQFLHSNPFYQQHSRDPSNGRYNGAQLLFSIPHARFKPELTEETRERTNKSMIKEMEDTITYGQTNTVSNSDDHTKTDDINPVTPRTPTMVDKTINRQLPKVLTENTDNFLHNNEQMMAVDIPRNR